MPDQPERPTPAGIYDFYLGGSAHTAADRAAGERIAQLAPEVHDGAWANRGFLQRSVTRMASEWGIRQFLDIGAGLPTQRNTHDVVAEAIPDGRVVYVDNDSTVVARARELLAGHMNTAVIDGDVRKPDEILQHPEAQRLVDLSEPVGLLLVAVLHFVPDDDDPWGLVSRYVAAVPSGSYLALSHTAVGDQLPAEVVEEGAQVYSATATGWTDRTKTEIERFFSGLEILPPYPGAPPGVAYAGLWGAEDPEAADSDGSRLVYAAVARKP